MRFHQSPNIKDLGYQTPQNPPIVYSVNGIVQNLFLLFICDLFVFFDGEKPNETQIVQLEPFFLG
jgi:hypothetical protein